MSKIKLKKRNMLYSSIAVLDGANVKAKPNYITIALTGRLCYDAK
jgi:hypothetical protein